MELEENLSVSLLTETSRAVRALDEADPIKLVLWGHSLTSSTSLSLD